MRFPERVRGPITVSAAVAVLFGITSPPADADSTVRQDRRHDAPATIDIKKVGYRHLPRRVAATVKVPRLGTRGRATLQVTKFDIFEAGYVVRVRRHADGRVSRRLFYFNHFDLRPRRCKVTGSWRPRHSTVRVSVPRRCLKHHRANRLYLRAWMERGGRSDRAPAVRNLARG